MENKPCLGFAMVSVFPEFCFIFPHYPRHRKFLYTSRTQLYSLILNRRCSLSLISLFLMNLCYTMWYLVVSFMTPITFFSSLFSMNNYTFWQFVLIMYILCITQLKTQATVLVREQLCWKPLPCNESFLLIFLKFYVA